MQNTNDNGRKFGLAPEEVSRKMMELNKILAPHGVKIGRDYSISVEGRIAIRASCDLYFIKGE